MKTLIPRFNAGRMVMDYVRGFYGPAARQGERLANDQYALARDYAAWKRKLAHGWGGVSLDPPRIPGVLLLGEPLRVDVDARLNGLDATDVIVECLLGHFEDRRFIVDRTVALTPVSHGPTTRFGATFEPLPGLQQIRVRMRPVHPAMSHPFELGAAVWA
jgi:starch phosphorylase